MHPPRCRAELRVWQTTTTDDACCLLAACFSPTSPHVPWQNGNSPSPVRPKPALTAAGEGPREADSGQAYRYRFYMQSLNPPAQPQRHSSSCDDGPMRISRNNAASETRPTGGQRAARGRRCTRCTRQRLSPSAPKVHCVAPSGSAISHPLARHTQIQKRPQELSAGCGPSPRTGTSRRSICVVQERFHARSRRVSPRGRDPSLPSPTA